MSKCPVCGDGFEQAVHNQRYCTPRCKRKRENQVRQGVAPVPVVFNEAAWQKEEDRKRQRAEAARAKNDWILRHKSFAMFDIETSNLDASIGEILCACVKPRGKEAKIFVARHTDEKAVEALRDELEKYDYVTTWYGTGFDLPYLTTRLLVYGFRPLLAVRHVDLYYTARAHLKLHSNRLQVAAETLLGDSSKTRVIGSVWNAAMRGNKEAMGYIIEHCKKDVEELERLFEILAPFRNIGATPLRYLGQPAEHKEIKEAKQ